MSISLSQYKNRNKALLVEFGKLHSAISFTRSTTATYINSAGVLTTAGVNVPRYEYSLATGSYLGLLMEPSSTNLCRQSQNLTTTWNSGVTVSATLSSSYFAGNVPYYFVSKLTTATSASTGQGLVAVAANAVLTLSFACRATSTSNTFSFGLFGSTSSWGSSANVVFSIMSGPGTLATASGTLTYVSGLSTTVDTVISLTRTYLVAETPTVYFYPDRHTSTTSGNGNLITRVQVEALSFSTSYIPTTTATVSRSNDLGTISTPSLIGFNPNAGTCYGVIDFHAFNETSQTRVLFANSTLSARFFYTNTGNINTYNGTTVVGVGTLVDNVQMRICSSYGTNLAGSSNGSAAVTGGTNVAMTSTALYISANGNNSFCGHIQSLIYEPVQRTNVEMQQLSSPQSITELFWGNKVGVVYDPSDFSTMFQDQAGTIPVTATGQLVAKILDKSGNGNYASAPTGSAPTLMQDSQGSYYLKFNGAQYLLMNTTTNFNTAALGFANSGMNIVTTFKILYSASGQAGYLVNGNASAMFLGRNSGGSNIYSTISTKARQSSLFITNGSTTTTISDQATSSISVVSSSTGLSGVGIIGAYATSSGWSVGNFHQVIIVAGTLTPGQQSYILRQLNSKLIAIS